MQENRAKHRGQPEEPGKAEKGAQAPIKEQQNNPSEEAGRQQNTKDFGRRMMGTRGSSFPGRRGDDR